MHIDWWTLALQAVNFLVLIALLRHFLYRPAMAAIEARRAALLRDREAAAQARQAAEQEAEAQRKLTAEIDTGRRAIIAAAEAEAGERTKTLMAEARRDADQLLDHSRQQVAAERRDAAQMVRGEAARLAVAMAGGLLGNGPKPSAEAFLEILEAELGEPGRAAEVEIACMPPLDPEAEARWRGRLGRRFSGAALVFRPDPSLLAGARLVVDGVEMEASWRDALARAERDLIDHVQSG
jgi:F-type H+-transporting ATPase subunit b